MDIYVGNLPYTATEGDVSELFAAFGPVERVKIITDRETGQSKGFAFVTLGDQTQLNAAIEALNEYDYNGRALRVNASEPKESRRLPRLSRSLSCGATCPYPSSGSRRTDPATGGPFRRRGCSATTP